MSSLTRRQELLVAAIAVIVLTALVLLVKALLGDIPAAFVAGVGAGVIATCVAVANQFIGGAWRAC